MRICREALGGRRGILLRGKPQHHYLAWGAMERDGAGQIVILNGPPRSGKSSIAAEIQERFEGVWMNLGVDHFKQMTPARLQPGIGLRPGGERPDLEPV